MEHLRLFSATLGIVPPWAVTEVIFSANGSDMTISVVWLLDQQLHCPTCGTAVPGGALATEIWRHANLFQHTAYLRAKVPNLVCPACGVVAVERPWCRAGSKFTLLGITTATA
jgi:predicted RNA-binding Zn-ribbon protein involved in translation (DUF1610 family)